MTYKVTYSETLRGDYIIEADSEQEAVDKLYKLMEEEQIDTLDLDIVCSNATAVHENTIDAGIFADGYPNFHCCMEPFFL